MRRKGLAAIFACTLLILGAWAGQRHWLEDRTDHASQAPSARPKSQSPHLEKSYPVPSLRWERGMQQRFALVYSGQIPAQNESQKVFDVTVEGTLLLTILGEASVAGASGTSVWVQLDGASFRSGSSVPESLQLELEQAFKSGAPFRLAERGFAMELLHGSALTKTAKYFWEGLAMHARVVVPEQLSQESYQVKEKITTTEASAIYVLPAGLASLNEESTAIHLQKTLSTGPAWQSESAIAFKPRFAGLEELRHQSQETLDLGGQPLRIRSELSLAALEPLKLADISNYDERLKTLLQQPQQGSSELSIQSAVLGDLNFPTLWSLLPREEVSQDLYLKLKAWIILHPGDMGQLLASLRSLDSSDARLRSAIKALGAAAHPEAQALLVGLLGERRDDVPLVKRVVTTLGLVPVPSPEAERAVEQIMQNGQDPGLRRSAQLALGIMGGNLLREPGQEARGQAIEKKALRLLQEAPTDALKQDVLAMLGNLGPANASTLKPYLESENPAVRAHAYFALRRSPDPETPQRLVRAYGAEPALDVRRQILQALYYREADAAWFEGIREILERPLPVDDQLFLARALARHAEKDPRQSTSLLGDLEAKIPPGTPARQQLEQLQQLAARSLQGQGASFN